MKICRPHVSPYFKDNFVQKEKACLEAVTKDLYYTNIFDAEVEVLISDTHLKIENYDLKNIKLLIHANSGFDNLLPLKKNSANFPIVLGNEIRAHAVCQYILTALYTKLGAIPMHHNWDKTRAYSRQSLKQLKVQLIGYGQIGNLVYDSLKNLCGEIFIYDPFKNHANLKIEEADVIICAASLSRSSQTLLDQEMINKFKPQVLFINPSRGKIVDQKALIAFLKENAQAYAYLDVFENEPCDFSIFPKNTHLSSHIAGVYDQLDQETLAFEQKILRDFLHLNLAEFRLNYQHILLEDNPVYKHE